MSLFFIVFLLFASFFFFPFPRCAAVVKVYRAGRGGRQPLEVLAGGVVTALAWNWRFLCRVRFLTRILTLRCIGCFFFFLHLGSCGQSLLGRCKRQWGHCDLRWRQGFPLCPANGGPSDLTLSTDTRCSFLQTLLPKPSTSAIVWIFQVPGGGLGIQASN